MKRSWPGDGRTGLLRTLARPRSAQRRKVCDVERDRTSTSSPSSTVTAFAEPVAKPAAELPTPARPSARSPWRCHDDGVSDRDEVRHLLEQDRKYQCDGFVAPSDFCRKVCEASERASGLSSFLRARLYRTRPRLRASRRADTHISPGTSLVAHSSAARQTHAVGQVGGEPWCSGFCRWVVRLSTFACVLDQFAPSPRSVVCVRGPRASSMPALSYRAFATFTASPVPGGDRHLERRRLRRRQHHGPVRATRGLRASLPARHRRGIMCHLSWSGCCWPLPPGGTHGPTDCPLATPRTHPGSWRRSVW